MKKLLVTLTITSCFLILLGSCNGSAGKSDSPKKIEVTGSAEMEIVPNEIFMTFTLKEYLDAARKKVKLESIKTDFLKLCKEAGIADSSISISSYAGNERWDYWWYKRHKVEPDFMSSISYTIKVSSPDKLDQIVSGLNEKAIDNFAISKVSHSDIEKLRKEVKIQALIASKKKAEYLANSIGEKIGEALLIQEIEDSYGNYYGAQNNYFNSAVSQTSMNSESNNSSAPDFQKMKLRYEMKVEYRLK
jgi:uncharacterized protein